jgi:anti-sigma B factor antagonist
VAVDFEITAEEIADDTWVVAVRGEIDLFTAPGLKADLSRAIDARARRLVVDMTETTFLDSSSLGVLIGAQKRLAARGGALVIACKNRAILNTFKVTGLSAFFTLAHTREEALAGGAVGTG